MSGNAIPVQLSVVIPAFNEARRIRASLASVGAHLEGRYASYEILVVDDGSTEPLDAALDGLGGVGRDVRLIRHERNRGKGAALRTGVAASRGEEILTTDADLSTPISEIERAREILASGADIVIASREATGTRIERDQSVLRKNMGRTFNRFVRILTGLPYADTQCGFKLYRGAAARELFGRARVDGFATDVEILVIARAHGLAVREMPVIWDHVAESKVRMLIHPAEMLADLVRIRANEVRGRYAAD